jgi:hypothetical protein
MRKRGWSLRRWVRSASEVWVMITPDEHNLLVRACEERDALQRRFTSLQHIAGRLQMELDEMTRNQINLKDEAAHKTLQRIAARLGYLTVGSAAHGEGSIRQMLLAIARGELVISRRDDAKESDTQDA